ncbi:ATP-binding protein [Streptomyces sp. NBC_00433]
MITSPTPRSMCVSSIRLAAETAAVRLSREFVRGTLPAWGLPEQIDSAELIVSELVTNAVKNSAGQGYPCHVGVQLRLVGGGLYIEVWDRGAGSPVIAAPTFDAEGGRGLFLVESMSTRLGVQRSAVGGKIVWAELALSRQAEADQDMGTADLALMQRALDGFPYGRTP